MGQVRNGVLGLREGQASCSPPSIRISAWTWTACWLVVVETPRGCARRPDSAGDGGCVMFKSVNLTATAATGGPRAEMPVDARAVLGDGSLVLKHTKACGAMRAHVSSLSLVTLSVASASRQKHGARGQVEPALGELPGAHTREDVLPQDAANGPVVAPPSIPHPGRGSVVGGLIPGSSHEKPRSSFRV